MLCEHVKHIFHLFGQVKLLYGIQQSMCHPPPLSHHFLSGLYCIKCPKTGFLVVQAELWQCLVFHIFSHCIFCHAVAAVLLHLTIVKPKICNKTVLS